MANNKTQLLRIVRDCIDLVQLKTIRRALFAIVLIQYNEKQLWAHCSGSFEFHAIGTIGQKLHTIKRGLQNFGRQKYLVLISKSFVFIPYKYIIFLQTLNER